MATSPVYPIAGTIATNLRIYDPDLQVDYSKQFSLGFQRQLTGDMALEVRYVGTRNSGTWATQNWNEINVIENGFRDEFKLAQTNLYANIAAGKGQTFAYMGPGTGTSPLPIFLAHFNAAGAAQAGDPSKYIGTNWTNSTFVGFLSRLNPSILGFASTNASTGLYGNSTFRNNGVTAGLPVNFWVLNPNVGLSEIVTNGPSTRYDALQIDFRRRMSRGFLFTANYTLASAKAAVLDTIREPYTLERALNGVPQAFKLTGVWEVPYGNGRSYGTNASRWLDALAGGWTVGVAGKVQTGTQLSLSGVRLVGMSEKELRSAFDIRIDDAKKIVYSLPQDIIDNTIRAFSTSATGYTQGQPQGRYLAPASTGDCVEVYIGDCGEPRKIYVTGPIFSRFDLNFKKRVPLGGSRSFDFQLDLLNVFDAINFNPVFQASSTPTINQVTTAYTDLNNTFDPGGRVGQIMLRFNW
jgi:hypothetical protein